MDYAKRDLTKFIQAEVQPSDLVAVIKTSGSVGIMQKFTNDKEELLASIDALKWQPLTSVGVASFAPMEISFSSQVLSNLGGLSEAMLSKITDAQGVQDGIRDTVNGTGGLQVLAKVIEAMGYMRGKKTILYVSHGFSPIGGDNTDTYNRNTARMYTESDKAVVNASSGGSIAMVDADSLTISGKTYVTNNFLRAITESANRSGISIFPIDPRGAATTNISATDVTGTGMGSLSPDQMNNGVTNRNDQIRYQQDTLKYLARETGGKAFVNSNEVANDLKESLDIQKGYYLLAYEPDADTFDPKSAKYNKFDIKVNRPGASVSYRSGFFNTVIGRDAKKTPTAAQTILEKFLAPYNFADIGVDLSSIYAGIAGNKATIRSFVNILPKDLTLIDDPATGKKLVKFDMYVAVFNDQGLSAGSAAQNFAVSFDPKSLDAFLKSGVISTMGFAVDKPGVYRVKVLVKDSNSNKIGTTSQSLYVPDMNKQPLSFSGLLLQTFTPAEWADIQKNPAAANPQKMQVDTAFRHYKTGQVLTYTYSLGFSPNAGDSKVSITTKLVKDGQTVFNGNAEDAAVQGGQKVNRRNAINLGTDMKPGKYTLQITAVGDKSQKPETEIIDFEILG
jgi:VWFA-related protein